MSDYLPVIKKESRPYFESMRDDMAARKDPEFFWPTGTQVYVGRQGSGKTISAVYHAWRLKRRYPKMILVTNLLLNGRTPVYFALDEEQLEVVASSREGDRLRDKFLRSNLARALAELDRDKEYIYFSDMSELSVALVMVNNGMLGVAYIIDEIHTYFNALDSKNIPMFVFTEISQQRKQRKCIIGTSQLFLRMAKPFREQCDNIIICNTYFGILTTQKAYDGMTLEQDYDGTLTGNKRKSGWFFHRRWIRELYDTYQKVVSGSEQYEQSVQNTVMIDRKKLKKI